MEYLFHVLILVGIYAILAISLDLVAGHTGLISVAHGAFYGLGAYASALLSTSVGTGIVPGVLVSMAVAALVSCIVSFPSLRLRDDYFVIATFGFQMILFGVFNNWVELTRGPAGIPGIPHPSILGWTVASYPGLLALTSLFAVLAYATSRRITMSPFGRVLHAIREDEIFTEALGKNPIVFKVKIFAVSAALAAAAGALYAHYVTYIDPTSFTVTESILVVSMVVIGGAGSRWGPVIGAAVLVVLPEALRFTGLPSSVAANLRQILYGSLLVVFMIVRPTGLVGRYGFGR